MAQSGEKKEQTPMEKLTAGYEQLMKGKAVKKAGKSNFDKAIKKAVKPTKRGSK